MFDLNNSSTPMTVQAPTSSQIHQTFETEDFLAVRAMVEGMSHYVATASEVDADLTAAQELLQGSIDAMSASLNESVAQVSQTANANTSAIQSNITALSQQVQRLSSAESALSQQETLNEQQEVLLQQVDALSQLLSAATNEQAGDIVEALFNTKIALGGTAVDLRFLLTFEQALKIYRTTHVDTSDWAGTERYEIAWSIPGFGHQLEAPGKLYSWPEGTPFDGQDNNSWALMGNQAVLPSPEDGPDFIKAFYQVSDAFGIPAVNLEKEVIFKKKTFNGTNIKAYVPFSKQELTYAGGTQALVGLLVSTYGSAVQEQFFPATPAAPALGEDTNEAPTP